MQKVRRKWKGFKVMLCFYLTLGACISLIQGTQNAYAQEEVFRLELVFDTNTGEIQRVRALPVGSNRPRQDTLVTASSTPTATDIRVGTTLLYRLEIDKSFIRTHSLVYTWGSPGCIKIQTTSGTERICW